MNLLEAVSRGDLETLESLLSGAGGEDNASRVRDSEGNTPLLRACERGDKKIVRALLRAGCSLSDQNNDGEGVLHVCFSNGHPELGRYLIGKGADPTLETSDGMDWIMYCDMAGVDMVPLGDAVEESNRASELARLNRDVEEVSDRPGASSMEGRNKSRKHGVDGGARLGEDGSSRGGGSSKDRRREEAASSGLSRTEVSDSIALIGKAQEVLECRERERAGESGAAARLVEEMERKGGERLRALAVKGDVSGVEKLLSAGVSPEEADELGNTALHDAAFAGQKRCCKALLRFGADIGALNSRGEGVVAKAREGGWVELAGYLVEKGGDG